MRIFAVLIALFVCVFADSNISDINSTLIKQEKELKLRQETLSELNATLNDNSALLRNDYIYLRYSNYLNYHKLDNELKTLESELSKTKKSNLQQIDELNKKMTSTKEQIEILKEFENATLTSMLIPPEVENIKPITSPFDMFYGYSMIKNLKAMQASHLAKIGHIESIISLLNTRLELLKQMSEISKNPKINDEISDIKTQISEMLSAKEFAKTTYDVFIRKLDEQIISIRNSLKEQGKTLINILITIGVIFAIAFLLKFISKKYLEDGERLYIVNKVVNLTSVFLVLMVILFTFLENMTYIITVLGFVSAGLAIAMKDMFMSILGWFVITFGGTLSVGDRIKVRNTNNENLVGDIIDISLLRITIFEDITYVTYREQRRAGRIVFIPNNYIFNNIILNYTHSGMKTVWDGIDITLTFDSNHTKAMHIIRNIARKYSKGYTDIAKKQMVKLRNQYNIKNSNIEPRIFSFFEPYGITISVWYMTNSYTTLALRSNISSDILEALRAEPDIDIAYPSHTLYRGDKKNFHKENEELI
ncbi:MAG: mechanosensitive ion channel [Campylobacter sp.]|nr:mechanosensitive ion channel [Campylobacter sp.]